MKDRILPKRILFVDFNGVISYDPFWISLHDTSHPLHEYKEPIEYLLFKGDQRMDGLVEDWMIGKYTSEQVHKKISESLGFSYQLLIDVFYEDCKKLDISLPILNHIQYLRKDWYCILRTDNMDSFHRFTLPANPYLFEAFDEIHNSYCLRQLKSTDGGKYFLITAANLGIDISKCVLIDDSHTNCKLFEDLGGMAFCTKSETDALGVLKKLRMTER